MLQIEKSVWPESKIETKNGERKKKKITHSIVASLGFNDFILSVTLVVWELNIKYAERRISPSADTFSFLFRSFVPARAPANPKVCYKSAEEQSSEARENFFSFNRAENENENSRRAH